MRVDEIVDQALVDGELAVGEQLDQHRAQQRVVGRRQRDHRQRAQPRGEVGSRDRPRRRRRARGEQHGTPRSSRARLRRWNSAASSIGPRRASSTTSAPVASAAGTSASSSARAGDDSARRLAAAQIATRWLLPEPAGPTSSDDRAPASPASARSARAPLRCDGPTRKSSRAKLSAWSSASGKLTRDAAGACATHAAGSASAVAGIERAREVCAARSGPARRSPPRPGPRAAGRRSRTGSRRRTARTSARPDAGRRSAPTRCGCRT